MLWTAALGAVAPGRAAEAAPAAGLRLVLPATRVFHAGELVEVRWSGDVADVEEFELLVSFDGGRHWTAHASPELDPRFGRYLWRVPAVEARDVRLMARFRRDEHERAGEPTASFAIVGGRGDGVVPEESFRGAGPEPGTPVASGTASDFTAPESSWCAADDTPAEQGPRRGAILPQPAPGLPSPATPDFRAPESRTAARPRPILFVPMRN